MEKGELQPGYCADMFTAIKGEGCGAGELLQVESGTWSTNGGIVRFESFPIPGAGFIMAGAAPDGMGGA